MALGADNRHWFKQSQSLPIYPAFESNYVICRVPEIHPTEVLKFRFICHAKIELHVIMSQLEKKPNLFLPDAQGFTVGALVAPG
jgi:hypothetical protein